MEEAFLHYIWKFQLFRQSELKTTAGEKLIVLKAGIHNLDSGPDFFNGQIRLAETRWAGNIEIHLRASDWMRHLHQNDQAYDKVILHVVWENDQDILRKNGELIPTLELNGLVKRQLVENYQQLQNASSKVPCANQINSVPKRVINQQLDRMLVSRLERKSAQIRRLLKQYQNDWEQCLYHLLCKYFGFNLNSVPMELLAVNLPFSKLRKHLHNLTELESLLYGQAGFLEEVHKDAYPKMLQKEFNYLKQKFGLVPIQKHLWKYSKLRPAGFPSIRISQLANLLHSQESMFQKLIEIDSLKAIEKMFQAQASAYWDMHYNFNKQADRARIKSLGKNSIHLLLINVIAPLYFTYGQEIGKQSFKDRAVELLEEIPAEKNHITRLWNKLGVKALQASDTQAMIELKKQHCDLKKCINCSIGNQILNPK